MTFIGITRSFSTVGEDQYNTIGAFWDELEEKYGLDNLRGLGYGWQRGSIEYCIGFKHGVIPGANFSIDLPDEGWITVKGRTDSLKEIYDGIYTSGTLKYEIEIFFDSGECEISYVR
jgi:hypothetical protein